MRGDDVKLEERRILTQKVAEVGAQSSLRRKERDVSGFRLDVHDGKDFLQWLKPVLWLALTRGLEAPAS
jgi:hypothetical protein